MSANVLFTKEPRPQVSSRAFAGSASKAPAPVDYASLFRNEVVLSSAALGWAGITVEERIKAAPGKMEVPGGYTELVLDVILSGPVQVYIKCGGYERREVRQAGAWTIFPPGEGLISCWEQRVHYASIRLSNWFLAHVVEEEFGVDPARLECPFERLPGDDFVGPCALQLAAELRRAEPGQRLAAESLANVLAVRLLRRFPGLRDHVDVTQGGLPLNTLRRVQDFIEANLENNLGLADLAALANLGQRQFTLRFKRNTGLAPHQFLLRRRVERARQRVRDRHHDMNLAQIAADCGFYDESHLNRHFKNLLGVTPAQYRKGAGSSRPSAGSSKPDGSRPG